MNAWLDTNFWQIYTICGIVGFITYLYLIIKEEGKLTLFFLIIGLALCFMPVINLLVFIAVFLLFFGIHAQNIVIYKRKEK